MAGLRKALKKAADIGGTFISARSSKKILADIDKRQASERLQRVFARRERRAKQAKALKKKVLKRMSK